jgi:hypothetical protein
MFTKTTDHVSTSRESEAFVKYDRLETLHLFPNKYKYVDLLQLPTLKKNLNTHCGDNAC